MIIQSAYVSAAAGNTDCHRHPSTRTRLKMGRFCSRPNNSQAEPLNPIIIAWPQHTICRQYRTVPPAAPIHCQKYYCAKALLVVCIRRFVGFSFVFNGNGWHLPPWTVMELRLQVLIDTNANQQFIVNVSWQMGFKYLTQFTHSVDAWYNTFNLFYFIFYSLKYYINIFE